METNEFTIRCRVVPELRGIPGGVPVSPARHPVGKRCREKGAPCPTGYAEQDQPREPRANCVAGSSGRNRIGTAAGGGRAGDVFLSSRAPSCACHPQVARAVSHSLLHCGPHSGPNRPTLFSRLFVFNKTGARSFSPKLLMPGAGCLAASRTRDHGPDPRSECPVYYG